MRHLRKLAPALSSMASALGAAALTALAVAACTPPPVTPVLPVRPPTPAPEAPALPRRSSGLQVVFDLKKSPIPVTIGEPAIDLWPMPGRTFVGIQDVLLYVDGDTLRSDPMLQRGLSDAPRPHYLGTAIGAMGGRWPDAAWVQVTYRGERYFRSTFLRWSGDGWVPGAAAEDVAVTILPLPSAWSLVVSRSPASYIPDDVGTRRLSLLHPRWRVPVGQLDRADSVATLPDGTLYAVADGRVRAWAPDGSRAPLPSPDYGTDNPLPVVSAIVALSPTAIYLLNTLDEERGKRQEPVTAHGPPRPAHQLLRFDGQRWFVEPTPAESPDRLFAGPHGALWVGQGDALFERAEGGTWAALEVPARIDQVWVSPADDVWATSGENLLLHTRPLPPDTDLTKLAPPTEPPGFDESCVGLTALLDEVPRTTPADFDFRAQLDVMGPVLGKLAPYFAFYELMIAGKRRLAAHLPERRDLGAPLLTVGAELVARAAQRGAPRPRLVCMKLPDEADAPRLLRSATREPPERPPEPPPKPTPSNQCASPLVVLFALPKTAPADFDFPRTREALRGHGDLAGLRFYDYRRKGQRVIAAHAGTRKEADALAALVKRQVPGSTPTLVCEPAPTGARSLKVDPATGNVVK